MAQTVIPRLSRLSSKTSALFLCDMQEKFRPSIQYFGEIVFNSSRLLRTAKILDMPIVCTEQYPKGLYVLLYYN
jgi:nicotinamidase-related amidase